MKDEIEVDVELEKRRDAAVRIDPQHPPGTNEVRLSI